MSPEEREDIRTQVVEYLQEIVMNAGLNLQVSAISDNVYRALNPRIPAAELEWDWAIQFLNEDEHFDLAIGVRLDDAVDGIAVGVYREPELTLEIQAVEVFVRNELDHPLTGRMTMLTLIAATYFLLLVDGRYLHVVEPVHPRLVEHYESFGLNAELRDGVTTMVGDVETLEGRIGVLIDRFNQENAPFEDGVLIEDGNQA